MKNGLQTVDIVIWLFQICGSKVTSGLKINMLCIWTGMRCDRVPVFVLEWI